MSKLRKMLVEIVEEEIEARGQKPVVVNTEMVHRLNAKQYSLQEIADCVVLEHYKFSAGFNKIANRTFKLLDFEDRNIREQLYTYLDARRLTVKKMKDPEFERRVNIIYDIHAYAMETLYDEADFIKGAMSHNYVWEWMVSTIPALNNRSPLEVLAEDPNGYDIAKSMITRIAYGDYS